MPRMHKFCIELNDSGRGKVEMDGKPLDGVRRVSIEGGVDQIPIIKLEMECELVSNKAS